MKKTSKAFAYCWRSGQIGVGPNVPQGTVKLAAGDEAALREVIGKVGRLSRGDNETMSVPGVPEAANDEAASQAAWDFADRIAEHLYGKEAA